MLNIVFIYIDYKGMDKQIIKELKEEYMKLKYYNKSTNHESIKNKERSLRTYIEILDKSFLELLDNYAKQNHLQKYTEKKSARKSDKITVKLGLFITSLHKRLERINAVVYENFLKGTCQAKFESGKAKQFLLNLWKMYWDLSKYYIKDDNSNQVMRYIKDYIIDLLKSAKPITLNEVNEFYLNLIKNLQTNNSILFNYIKGSRIETRRTSKLKFDDLIAFWVGRYNNEFENSKFIIIFTEISDNLSFK